MSKYIDNVVAASRADVERVFRVLKWTPGELTKTLSALIEQQLVTTAPIAGWDGEHLLSAKASVLLPR